MLDLIVKDEWLKPFEKEIKYRHQYIKNTLEKITQNFQVTLSDFATGYMYFGLQKNENEWVIREWAPNASQIFLIGDFNNWQRLASYKFNKIENGVWELKVPLTRIHHGNLYKLLITSSKGTAERIPAWCKRVVQDTTTGVFSAQVWEPEYPYSFKNKNFRIPKDEPLLIYEAHVGMATSENKVGTYTEFREKVLPHIKENGYNVIQLMAIQEHPYYGSFGYHVANFFAPSSRFGTPDELKELIDTAHQMGIAVIMDLVHSHSVKNIAEGIASIDGSEDLYFHNNPEKRYHSHWDSLCFDYGKEEVIHFLLSNCKYWLEEYQFDGFRFDGVTSMIYEHHGLGVDFVKYSDYYDTPVNIDALTYLTLANKLIHDVNPNAITIAEEVSGMPGLALTFEKGGHGFDYRMAMNIPDYWIKIIKDKEEKDWQVGEIFWELTNRRKHEKTVSYAESHDQALVGDKTIIFRLLDADMYWHMSKDNPTLRVNNGIALHKMIRLITSSTINGGYLNFMGNEFGHPEWIDFPREGNNWSYQFARRQWNLLENHDLKYHQLWEFDKAMVELLKSVPHFEETPIYKIWENNQDQTIAYMRDDLLFVFNFHTTNTYTNYTFLCKPGKYSVILNTDNRDFGGFGSNDDSVEHFTQYDALYAQYNQAWLKLYLPARSALVFRRKD